MNMKQLKRKYELLLNNYILLYRYMEVLKNLNESFLKIIEEKYPNIIRDEDVNTMIKSIKKLLKEIKEKNFIEPSGISIST